MPGGGMPGGGMPGGAMPGGGMPGGAMPGVGLPSVGIPGGGLPGGGLPGGGMPGSGMPGGGMPGGGMPGGGMPGGGMPGGLPCGGLMPAAASWRCVTDSVGRGVYVAAGLWPAGGRCIGTGPAMLQRERGLQRQQRDQIAEPLANLETVAVRTPVCGPGVFPFESWGVTVNSGRDASRTHPESACPFLRPP